MNLQSLAKSLNGEVSGRVILAPGPNHSPKDRSMTVTIDRDAPDGFLVHSFSGDDFRDCRDYIKTIIGGRTFERQQEPITPTKLDNLIYAKQIWISGRSPEGTQVETYLSSRGLKLPLGTAHSIRFDKNCPFKGEKVPAMVCAMLDTVTSEFRGVHRTRLNPKDKAMLGSAKGAVVKLTPDEQVTYGLHICEGIETGLALLQRGFEPMWCTLSAGGMASFPLINGIESLTIFADNDENKTGQNAAIKCGKRWQDAGREVRIFSTLEAGTDFADRGYA